MLTVMNFMMIDRCLNLLEDVFILNQHTLNIMVHLRFKQPFLQNQNDMLLQILVLVVDRFGIQILELLIM